MKIKKLDKVGEGTYGRLYLSETDENLVVIKRNLVDVGSDFMVSLKEQDILKRLDHPHIVKLIETKYNSPFNNRLSPIKDKNTKTDELFFVFERANCDLEAIIKKIPNHAIKLIMCQTLLGLEYMHKCGIIHRDIKPANLLYFEYDKFNADGFDFMVKLCDFGMCKFYDPLSEQTPGVSTYAFRAPEILMDIDYDYKSDIWSMGVIMYEMLYKDEFIKTVDDPVEVIKNIFTNIPTLPSWDKVMSMSENSLSEQKIHNFVKKHYDNINKKEDDSSLEYNFMKGLLTFDPDSRPNATEALDDEYFDDLRKYIEKCRKIDIPKDNFVVGDGNRKNIGTILTNLIKNIQRFHYLSIQMLFHVIDLYEHYLKKPKDYDVDLVVMVCIYTCIKYFTTMFQIPKFSDILPERLITNENLKLAPNIEKYIVLDLLDGTIYRKTFYEYLEGYNPSINDIIKIIDIYSKSDIKGKNYEEIAKHCLSLLK